MRAKTYQTNQGCILVKPYQQEIVFNMTFHKIVSLAFQWVGLELFGNSLAISEFNDYFHQCFHLLDIIANTFEILLKLGGFSDFLHHCIEAIKLSKFSVDTVPASLPPSASLIAANVTALGTSSHEPSSIDLLELTTLTPCMDFSNALRCIKIEGFSTCNVNVVIFKLINLVGKGTTLFRHSQGNTDVFSSHRWHREH